VQAGPGRLGIRRGQVRAAQAHLDGRAQTWRPVLGESRLPAGRVVEFAAAHPANDRVQRPITGYARAQAQADLPEQTRLLAAADQARQDADAAAAAYTQASAAARHRLGIQRAAGGYRHLAGDLDRLEGQTRAARARLDRAADRVAACAADPAITSKPDPESFLASTHAAWAREDQAAQQAAARTRQADQQQADQQRADQNAARRARARNDLNQQPGRRHGPRL